MKNKLIMSLILSIASLSASEKIYIDEKEFDHKDFSLHIHTGHNVWIETKSVHMNLTGLYTLETDIVRSKNLTSEYKKTWKCPYCFMYWPIGSPCKNAECPSKYKI